MKTIAWINHFAVAPSDGGGTRHFELGRELIKRGWRVHIASSDFNLHQRSYTRRAGPRHRAPIHERVEGVEFSWLWAAEYQKNDWRRAWNWLSFAGSVLRWRPKGSRADVVIGSSPHLFAAWAGERLARRWNVPFILEVRDLWPESMLAAGGRKGPGYLLLDRLAQHLYRRAERIICLAKGTQEYLAERGVDSGKLLYVPNGVDPAAFPETPRPPGRPLTLIYAGAHGPANGLDVVLDAAERLRERTDVKFLFIGDGPTKTDLVTSAKARGLTNVEFRPPVPKTRIPGLFAEADGGLMVLKESPLFAFGVSPNKLFDYFAAGLPVICNVPGEVAGMVRAAKGGEQAVDGTPDALADAIQRFAFLSTEDRADMGRSARAWVAREHGRGVLAERLMATLDSLANA